MAKKVEIYVNNNLCDLPLSGLKFAATYSIADINKLDSRSGSITKTFDLPGTNRNKQIFGFPDEIASTTAISQTVQPTARIEIDGTNVISGSLKITDVVLSEGNDISLFKCVILGNNASWKNIINSLKLSDLDLSDQDHIWNVQNIDTSETLANSRDYIYPLINYGKWERGSNVQVEDRFPAVRVKRVFEQIFNDAGYAVSSDFINSDFFKRLFMPFTQKSIYHPIGFEVGKRFRAYFVTGSFQEWKLATSFAQTIIFNNDSDAGYFDEPSAFNTATGVFTVGLNVRMNFFVSMNVQQFGIADSVNLKFQFRPVGQINYTTFKLHTFTRAELFAPNEPIRQFESGFKLFQTGDEVRVYLQLIPSDTATSVFKLIGGTQIWNVIDRKLTEGGTVGIASTLPDMYQVDFLKSIKTLFNLYFDTNPDTRTVTIEPFDDFYTSEVVDWTDKLDTTKERTLTYIGSNIAKNIEYAYKDDGNDKPVKQIRDIITIFEERREVNTNVFAKDGESIIATGFSPTLMYPARTIGFVETLIPKMWNELPESGLPQKNTEYNMRILYYKGVEATQNAEEWTWEGTTRTDYPNMLYYDEVNENDHNLMFRSLRRSHGLFAKYYRNSQKLFNEGRIFGGSFKFNDVDISNLDFRKLVVLRIKGELYQFKLNKVKEYDGEKSTKVELLTEVGTTSIGNITLVADDSKILTSQFQPTPTTQQFGILATVNGVTGFVYATSSNGGTFIVQSTATALLGNTD